MNLAKQFKLLFLLLLSGLLLTACGSGVSTTTGGASNAVSGYASKGPIDGGTVTIYAINSSGVKGNQLGSSATGSDGQYSIDIGSYTGSILIEVTGGTYKDEATGNTTTNSILRAAIPSASGNVTASVTAFTELAFQNAGSVLSASNISQANNLVSTIIGGVDIITTSPADATSSASQSATQAEKDYGLALGAISQLINDGGFADVSSLILTLKNDLSDGTLETTGLDLSSALTTFIQSANNQTGLTIDDSSLDETIASAINVDIISNTSPVANAGANQNVTTGTTVTLNGSGSSDADNDALTYNWSFTSLSTGSSTTLSDATAVSPTFAADIDGVYVLSLTVSDGTVYSMANSVTITAATKLAKLLPDTGQTKCYNNTEEIACPSLGEPFYGQDANFSTNPMNFTDNGNGTVTDNVTKLIWQQEDDNLSYNWYEASGTYDALNNSGTTDVCGALNLGSDSDWRLPNEDELMSIINYGTSRPSINSTYFPHTNSSHYWAASTYADTTYLAWYINFYYGDINVTNKTYYKYVRCVR